MNGDMAILASYPSTPAPFSQTIISEDYSGFKLGFSRMMERAYKPRKLPLQERSRATVEAILEAAAQVLEQQGYAASTTNAIAKRAGVSIGSLYEYFPDKNAVFAALKEKLHRAQFEKVAGKLSLKRNDRPATAIRQLLKARIDAALEQPAVVAILDQEVPASVFASEREDDFSSFAALMAVFAEHYSKHIRIKNLDVAIPLGIQTIDLIISHTAAHRATELEKPAFLDELSDMMCRYILKS